MATKCKPQGPRCKKFEIWTKMTKLPKPQGPKWQFTQKLKNPPSPLLIQITTTITEHTQPKFKITYIPMVDKITHPPSSHLQFKPFLEIIIPTATTGDIFSFTLPTTHLLPFIPWHTNPHPTPSNTLMQKNPQSSPCLPMCDHILDLRCVGRCSTKVLICKNHVAFYFRNERGIETREMRGSKRGGGGGDRP
ncbi:hypothetical protein Hanom_Chr12g01074171 [Helianthus anomalus]